MNYFYKLDGKVGDAFLSGDVNSITMKVYLIMLKRASITHFIDENGRKYFTLTREELAKVLNNSFKQRITEAIKKLEELGVLEIKKTKGKASKFYVG